MNSQNALIFTAAATALLAGCAAPQYSPPPFVPPNLVVPADQTVFFEADAVGVQIYNCAVSKTDPSRFEWAFIAPEAELQDNAGKPIGKHYAGPSWEARDGSKVVGEVLANNASPDADAIPWLLLKAKSTSDSGTFSRVKSVQRVSTVGGKAPAETCDASQLGRTVRIPYGATYYFYAAKS